MHTQYQHKFEYHMNACGSAAKQFHVHCLCYAEYKSTSVSLGDAVTLPILLVVVC